MSAPTKEQFNKKGTDFPIPVITLWKNKGKRGVSYFTGFSKTGINLLGFYHSKKENPLQPDLTIYIKNEDGKRGNEYASLWCNVSETSGKKYLSGYLAGEEKIKITGFINTSENPKAPYLKIYLRSELEEHKGKETKGSSVKEVVIDEFEITEDDLPF